MSVFFQIASKSNEFYQLVPRKNFVNEKIEPLNNEYHILANKQMLANLLDWEIAAKILTGAQYRLNGRLSSTVFTTNLKKQNVVTLKAPKLRIFSSF